MKQYKLAATRFEKTDFVLKVHQELEGVMSMVFVNRKDTATFLQEELLKLGY